MTQLSLAHRLWRMLPATARREGLAKVTSLLAPHPDRTPPPAHGGLVVAGELTRASGLGESARLMVAALQAMGVPTIPVDLGDAVSGSRVAVPIPPAGMPLVLHANSPMVPLTLLRAPRRLIAGRRVIGYWAWELPTMPASWRLGLDFVHEIWTLSRFSADAIRTLLPDGSPVVVRVVPPPVGLNPPVASAMTRADFGLPDDVVITLLSFSLASSFARKNPLAGIAAHRAAFGNRADRLLLVKVTHAEQYAEDFARLRLAAAGLDNVRFETRVFDSADRHALTACADIVLSLHRSEGLGLVPAEAMLLGVPVVATDWSATAEFMDAESAGLVGYRLIPAVDPRGVFEAPGALWADAEVEDAAQLLRAFADDPGLRRRIGEAGRCKVTQCLDDSGLRSAVQSLGLVL